MKGRGSVAGVTLVVGALLVLVPARVVRTQPPTQPPSEPPSYVGEDVCLSCHQDLRAGYAATVHAKVLNAANGTTAESKLGCEACHGPGSAHVAAGGGKGVGGLLFSGEPLTPDRVRTENAACLGCHERGARTLWEGSTHQQHDVACTSCHLVMHNESRHALLAKPSELQTCNQCHLLQPAQIFRNAHMPLRPDVMPTVDGKMDCSSCHQPHGSVTESLLNRRSVNDTCYSCHAEKRGPFLWQHVPVTENCLNCHNPHGSTQPAMLKIQAPRLCQTCHDTTRHPTDPSLPQSRFVQGLSCNNCHIQIHGSNHPSGNFLTR